MDLGLVLFFALVVLYTAYSLWLGRFSITMPMVFVFVGALTGAQVLGWIKFDLHASDIETVTEVTRALNVESGLNDGIAAPLVVLFIALVLEDYTSVGNFWVVTALAEITIGALVGLLLGWGGGWLPDLAGRWSCD